MAWKKLDISKYENTEPLELSSWEIKTAAAVIVGTRSETAQREIIIELMMSVTEESWLKLCHLLGDELIKKIMPEC